MHYVIKPHSNIMRFTVTSTPQVTAERIKSEFTTEIKQEKKGGYSLTRTWYQSVKIKISPGPNNGTNVSVSTGYTGAMASILVIVTLLCLPLMVFLIYNELPGALSGLVIFLTFVPIKLSRPLVQEVSAKLTHYTTP